MQAAKRWEKSPFGTIFPIGLPLRGRCETIVAFARLSPITRFARFFFESKLSRKTSQSGSPLPASLKDDTARMNDRNKHKVTGQMNHQTADPKANASVFLFFPTAHFLKTILASRTNGTFGFARHTSRPFAKPKEPFFAHPQ